jgi:hypothetical protein
MAAKEAAKAKAQVVAETARLAEAAVISVVS